MDDNGEYIAVAEVAHFDPDKDGCRPEDSP
jgi:hypothetical protein